MRAYPQFFNVELFSRKNYTYAEACKAFPKKKKKNKNKKCVNVKQHAIYCCFEPFSHPCPLPSGSFWTFTGRCEVLGCDLMVSRFSSGSLFSA